MARFQGSDMGVPISQMAKVAFHVLSRELRGVKRYPLVLMLEPLFRCNLSCAGCGKIQYPAETLRRQLTPQQCFDAVAECRAPIVSIAGGEPLLHAQIEEIVHGLVDRRKYVYLCTNGLLLKKHLDQLRPSKYLSLSIHLDGPEAEHDRAVSREGAYAISVDATRSAVRRGFRVTANCTLYNDADPELFGDFFDRLMALGIEGITVAPGYPYQTAPDQQHFLYRERTIDAFRRLLSNRRPSWRFNQSPLYLEFLKGDWDLECTPWGNPTYNMFGWQYPCYLLQEGHVASFQELLEKTNWTEYGRASGNPKCTDCMMHCGYEPTAVAETFRSVRTLVKVARLMSRSRKANNSQDRSTGTSKGAAHPG